MVTDADWAEFVAAAKFAGAWMFPNPGYLPDLPECRPRPLGDDGQYIWPAPVSAGPRMGTPGAHLFHLMQTPDPPQLQLVNAAVVAPSRYRSFCELEVARATRDAGRLADARFAAQDALARLPAEQQAAEQLRRLAAALRIAGKIPSDDPGYAGFWWLASLVQNLTFVARRWSGTVHLWPDACWEPRMDALCIQYGPEWQLEGLGQHRLYYRTSIGDIGRLITRLRCHPPLWTADGLLSAINRVADILHGRFPLLSAGRCDDVYGG